MNKQIYRNVNGYLHRKRSMWLHFLSPESLNSHPLQLIIDLRQSYPPRWRIKNAHVHSLGTTASLATIASALVLLSFDFTIHRFERKNQLAIDCQQTISPCVLPCISGEDWLVRFFQDIEILPSKISVQRKRFIWILHEMNTCKFPR